MSGYMGSADKAIREGGVAIRGELERQRAILERQLDKRFDRETPARSRFAIAAHITKTESKIQRLERALEDRGF